MNWCFCQPGIGNGYPIGAVVTTKEIASVMTRSKHFNTFGGSPLAGTIGSALLDVIEEDKLQQVRYIVCL